MNNLKYSKAYDTALKNNNYLIFIHSQSNNYADRYY